MSSCSVVPHPSLLEQRLNYTFRDPGLLRLALTHPSLGHEKGAAVEHNQRLEFLGDAVLQLVLSLELYEKFPQAAEGVLTKARAGMVNREALGERGRKLGIGEHLLMGRGEELHGGRQRTAALADALEAVMGAIFLDGGFDAASRFIREQFRDNAFGDEVPNVENPKGELQELLQARANEAPEYRLESVSGPDHARVFESAVFHRGQELGRGRGKTKKAAESQAALVALEKIKRERLKAEG